jgi:hypothetical protein
MIFEVKTAEAGGNNSTNTSCIPYFFAYQISSPKANYKVTTSVRKKHTKYRRRKSMMRLDNDKIIITKSEL